MFLFGFVSVAFTVLMLAVASVFDFKFREVPDKVWVIAVAVGLLLSLASLKVEVMQAFVFSAGLVFVFVFVLHKAGEIFPILYIGGGDLKALVAVASLNQFASPAQTVYFSLSVFVNALLLSAVAVPVCVFAWNLFRANKPQNPLFYFIGYPVKISSIKCNSFVSPLEKVSFDGKGKRQVDLVPNVDPDDEFERLKKLVAEKKIKDLVWVTPLPPFMFALLAGYIISIFFSTNLLFLIIFSIIGSISF
ncbi:MAG: prepilin peptidase [Candidatus Diapherotrites archaeon]|nr:prepilin peptidase [Candidatus Diapherotrites archaeon]